MRNSRCPRAHSSKTGLKALAADRRGAAAVEMALVSPILIMLLMGIVTYGSWIAMAHAVQQSANEAARSAIAGLSPAERAEIAQTTAVETLEQTYDIDPSQVAVAVADDGTTLKVDVSYDASNNPLLKMPLIPVPNSIIERDCAVQLTGL